MNLIIFALILIALTNIISLLIQVKSADYTRIITSLRDDISSLNKEIVVRDEAVTKTQKQLADAYEMIVTLRKINESLTKESNERSEV